MEELTLPELARPVTVIPIAVAPVATSPEADMPDLDIKEVVTQKAIYVVLKVTERCNLACPYCYFFFADDKTFEIHPATIPGDTVDGLIEFLRDAIENANVQRVHIGLHGGEPLLLKKAAFRRMCDRLRNGIDPLVPMRITMQTNGVLIDPEWVEIFETYQIGVGISFDGPEPVHNKTRITKKGKGTYAESRRGWELLQDAHKAGRMTRPGIICVVAPEQSGREIYQHFANDMDVRLMNFLWPNFDHDSPEVTPEFIDRCGDFMVDVCKAWFEGGNRGIEVRFIREIVAPLLDDEICREFPRNRNNPFQLITVSSNGDIAPDDIIRTLAPRFRETGYQVGKHTLADLVQSHTWLEVEQARLKTPEACQPCIWRNICRSGNPQHRFSKENGFDNPSIYCKSLKRVYSYITHNLIQGGIPLETIERRLEADYD